MELLFESLAIFFIVFLIVFFFLSILLIVCEWKIFSKAGEKGWKSIIPIYNTYILFKICGLSPWFLLIPFITMIPIEEIQSISYVISGLLTIYTSYKLAKAFGHGVGYTIGLVLLPFIFYPILAFGKSEYELEV